MDRRCLPVSLLAVAVLWAQPGEARARGKDARATASSARTHGLPLPPGTRKGPDGALRSSRGFKKSVEFFSRYLTRQKIPHRVEPTVEVRGVLLARFLSTDKSSPWLAIHVYKKRGITYLAVIPAPSAETPGQDAGPPAQKPR